MAAHDHASTSNEVVNTLPNEGVQNTSFPTPINKDVKGNRITDMLSSYFRLLFYADPKWPDIILLITGTLSAAAAGIPFPLMGILFGQLVDNLNTASCEADRYNGHNAAQLQAMINDRVLKLVYIGIGSFILIYIYVVCWSIFSRRLEARVRENYFKQLLYQDAAFFDKNQAGELYSRLNADVQAIQSGTSEKVGVCIACISFFLTAYTVAFIKVWKLAAILLSLVPVFLTMAGLGSIFTQKYASVISDAAGSGSSVAQETLSNIAIVQAFGAARRLEDKFSIHMMTAQKAGIKKVIASAIQAGAMYFIAYSANALSFWEGSRQIVKSLSDTSGGVSVGQIYTVIFLLVDACVVFGSIAPLLPLLGSAAVSFQRLRKDIETPAVINSLPESRHRLPTSTEGAISYKNVSFSYDSRPDELVLKNVSFDCAAGAQTAIVGLSGSGKSTVASLTARLYDPDEGAVTLDGQDLRTLKISSLRSFVSLVQQESYLLNRSVLENIALGLFNSPWGKHRKFGALILSSDLGNLAARIRAGEDMITAAQEYGEDLSELVTLVCRAAYLSDASDFINKLQNGYGTIVGTGGKFVSGGQRQKIAIARALVKDPKIIILDEATASLDSDSEKRIQMAINSIAKNCTIIIIAHRLSTISNSDKIIVMREGRVVEQGTHSELMACDGAYASMVHLQKLSTSERPYDRDSVLIPHNVSTGSKISEKSIALDEGPAERDHSVTAISFDELQNNPGTTKTDFNSHDSSKSFGYIMKSFVGILRPHLFIVFLAIVSAVVVGGSFSSAGVIFGNTVGKLSPCNTPQLILWAGQFFGGLFFMLAVVELLAYAGSWSGFGYVAEKLLYGIRILSFQSLCIQDLDWHQSNGRTPASLLSIITDDAAAVGGFSGSTIGTVLSIVVNFFIAVVLSHIVAWRIAIVCLVTVPLLLGSGIMQIRLLSSFERKHAVAFSKALAITAEGISQFKTISVLSIEHEILAQYRRALKAPLTEMAVANAYTNFWLAVASSTGNLIYAFAYWWGSTRIIKGEYTQTQFFIVLMAMLVSSQLWGQMFTLAPEFSRARAAASRILSLVELKFWKPLSGVPREQTFWLTSRYDVEAAIATSSGEAVGRETRGATVVFREVSFTYPAHPTAPVIKDLSLTIPAGQFCGLVGPSGSGKSTILHLVQRMYRPTSGIIEIDGLDICRHDGIAFRDSIAIVPQDSAMFDGTVKFNVGLGAVPGHDASDADIEEACRLANIHETVMSLPRGYDTQCGPNGSRLSGGQKQRLAIARALVRKPRLLLLDESTSALDAESEEALQGGIEVASRGITVLAITHRLHTIRKANTIFVVEGGEIVDQGRHEDLMERSQSYRVNASQQMLG